MSDSRDGRPIQEERKLKIEIPASHPDAQRILKLAASLATHQKLPSGIVINKLYKPGAEETFLDALRELGVDVDQIKLDLSRPSE